MGVFFVYVMFKDQSLFFSAVFLFVCFLQNKWRKYFSRLKPNHELSPKTVWLEAKQELKNMTFSLSFICTTEAK